MGRKGILCIMICLLVFFNPGFIVSSTDYSQVNNFIGDLKVPDSIFIFGSKAQPFDELNSVLMNANEFLDAVFLDSAPNAELLSELYQSGKAIYIVGKNLQPKHHDILYRQLTGENNKETIIFDEKDCLLATGVLKTRNGIAQIHVTSNAPDFDQDVINHIAKLHGSILDYELELSDEDRYTYYPLSMPTGGYWSTKYNSYRITSRLFKSGSTTVGSFTQYGTVQKLENHSDPWYHYISLSLKNESAGGLTYGHSARRYKDDCSVTIMAGDNLIDYAPNTSLGSNQIVNLSLSAVGPIIGWSFFTNSTDTRNLSSMPLRRMRHTVDYYGSYQQDTHLWRPALQHQYYVDIPWDNSWGFDYTFSNSITIGNTIYMWGYRWRSW